MFGKFVHEYFLYCIMYCIGVYDATFGYVETSGFYRASFKIHCSLAFINTIYGCFTLIYEKGGIVYSLFFPIIGLIGVKTGNLNYVFLPFIFGLIAKGLYLKDIIKCYFVFCWILIVGTFLCCHMGLLENMVSFREEKVRNSFGFIYATDFAAHIFYLVLMYFYLRSGKFNLIEIMLFCIHLFYCKSM